MAEVHSMDDLVVPPPQAQPAAQSLPPIPDTPIYHGSVSLWMGWKSLLLSALCELAGIGAAIYGVMFAVDPLRTGLIVGGIALACAAGLMTAYVIVAIRCLRYRITRKLIERETGILVKRIDALDLGRVKDVKLSQSLIQRMLHIGTIEIFSTDSTDPLMLIECIPDARRVYEQLFAAVIEISQRRGVVPMT